MRRAAALLVVATVAFSGCAKRSAASRDQSTAAATTKVTSTVSPTPTNYAALRVALLKALDEDAKNRGVPWVHPVESIVWNPKEIVIIEKTDSTKSVHDDCALAIAASTDANQKLTDNLHRQQNDPHYDPQANPVWPVKVQNAKGALMTRYDPNAESGPSC